MSYLAELDAALIGPRRAKRDLLQEAADHLDDATDALVEAGWPRPEARARAEAGFGPVGEIAAAYQTTLAVAASRRTAWMLGAALIGQPFLWDEGGVLATLDARSQAPDTWWFALLDRAIELGGGVLILGAVLGVLATGLGNRWVRAGRRIARATALLTLASAIYLPLLAAGMLGGSGSVVQMWLIAALALVVPLLAAAASARQTLAATARRPSGPATVTGSAR